jgi:hypothetical protein
MIVNRWHLALLALLTCAALAPAQQVRGVITRVDLEKKELVLQLRGAGVRGMMMTVPLGKDAQIRFGQVPGNINDLPLGRGVHVAVELRDGRQVAVQVNVNGRKPAAPQGAIAPRPEGPSTAPMPRKLTDDAGAYRGQLRRINRTEREIVVASPAGGDKETYTSLPVADNAKVTRDDKPIAFDDLKEEEQAVVRTEMRDGKRVATAVMVGKVSAPDVPAAPQQAAQEQPSKVTRLRQILQIADAILEMVEKREKK